MVYDATLTLILLPKFILLKLKLTVYHKYHVGINADCLKPIPPT